MQINYRKLRNGDHENYRRVRLQCLQNFPDQFGSTYEEEARIPKLKFEEYIETGSADNFMFGAFANTALIGLAGFSRAVRLKTRHRGTVVQMYVDPEFRGRRIGENLLRELIKAVFDLKGIELIELSVVAENRAAVNLYEKLGFELFGLQKNYFKIGEVYGDQKFMQLSKERFLEISGEK